MNTSRRGSVALAVALASLGFGCTGSYVADTLIESVADYYMYETLGPPSDGYEVISPPYDVAISQNF
jgi:hypothetical protein